MKAIATALVTVAGFSCLGAFADGRITVPLPDVSALKGEQARALLHQLADVNVITSNCPDYAITQGEWTLITGTGDRLAARMGLDAATYDRAYYGPAFALLDDPGSCARIGPQARPLIDRLIGMGGGTAPLGSAQ